jgi:hypothetical protein
MVATEMISGVNVLQASDTNNNIITCYLLGTHTMIVRPLRCRFACRLAMLGFAGMVATEMITGVNVLKAWGLQPISTLIGSVSPITGL